MTKYIVDFWMDGYDSEDQRQEAEIEYMEEALNFTASSVRIKTFSEELDNLRAERDQARDLVRAFVALEVYGDVERHQEDCRESVNKWESEK